MTAARLTKYLAGHRLSTAQPNQAFGGCWRKLTANRFQPLMLDTAMVKSTSSSSLNSTRTAAKSSSDPCEVGNAATDCNPDQRNGAGQTAAMYAGLFKRVELLDELKARGADLNAEDPVGNSASRLASGEIRTPASR